MKKFLITVLSLCVVLNLNFMSISADLNDSEVQDAISNSAQSILSLGCDLASLLSAGKLMSAFCDAASIALSPGNDDVENVLLGADLGSTLADVDNPAVSVMSILYTSAKSFLDLRNSLVDLNRAQEEVFVEYIGIYETSLDNILESVIRVTEQGVKGNPVDSDLIDRLQRILLREADGSCYRKAAKSPIFWLHKDKRKKLEEMATSIEAFQSVDLHAIYNKLYEENKSKEMIQENQEIDQPASETGNNQSQPDKIISPTKEPEQKPVITKQPEKTLSPTKEPNTPAATPQPEKTIIPTATPVPTPVSTPVPTKTVYVYYTYYNDYVAPNGYVYCSPVAEWNGNTYPHYLEVELDEKLTPSGDVSMVNNAEIYYRKTGHSWYYGGERQVSVQ